MGKTRGSVVGGVDGWERPSREDSPALENQSSMMCLKCEAWSGELGLEPSFHQYVLNMKLVFTEAKRVLADYGSIFLNIGDTSYGSGGGQKNLGKHSCYDEDAVSIPARIKGTLGNELQKKCLTLIPERVLLMMVDELGLVLRSKIVWWKRNAIPHSSKDKFTPDWEPVYFFTKRPRYWHELQLEPCTDGSKAQDGWGAVGGKKYSNYAEYSGKPAKQRDMRTMRCVWDIPVLPDDTAHIAPFPPKLIEPMIRAACPREVCLKCSKPKMPQYKGNEVSGWSKCECDAPFRKGIVADIFSGSGTALMVAKALCRDWVGIEIMQGWIDDAYRRLDLEQTSMEDWLKEQPDVGFRTLEDFDI